MAKREESKNMKNFLKIRRKTFMKIIDLKRRTKYGTIFFKGLKAYHLRIKNRILIENMLVQNYFPLKRLKSIINSWRNLTHLIIKSKIKAEYAVKFNESYLITQEKYEKEVKRLNQILEIMDNDIKKEIAERRALSKLYDDAMNKGVDVFLRETNNFVSLSSSNFYIMKINRLLKIEVLIIQSKKNNINLTFLLNLIIYEN